MPHHCFFSVTSTKFQIDLIRALGTDRQTHGQHCISFLFYFLFWRERLALATMGPFLIEQASTYAFRSVLMRGLLMSFPRRVLQGKGNARPGVFVSADDD